MGRMRCQRQRPPAAPCWPLAPAALLLFATAVTAGEVTCRTVLPGNMSDGSAASLLCTNHNMFVDALLLVRATASSTNILTHPDCVLTCTCAEPFVVPKGGSETTMVQASQRHTSTRFNINGSPAWEVAFAWKYSLDTTLAGYNSSVVYTPPWAGDVPYRVTQGHFSSFTHRNMRAIDYALPRNTPIVAAREGVVVTVADGHPDGMNCMINGAWNLDAYPANRVVVMHRDGTTASYVHLESGSLAVKLHSPVMRGTLLGASGNSGCSTAPHLHWQVDGHVGGFTIPEEDPNLPLAGPSWAPGFPTQGSIDTDTAWDCNPSTRGEPKEGWYMPGIPESAVQQPLPIPKNSRHWTMPPETPFQFYEPRPGVCLRGMSPCSTCLLIANSINELPSESLSLLLGDEHLVKVTCEVQPSSLYGNVSAICCVGNGTEENFTNVRVQVSSRRALMKNPRLAPGSLVADGASAAALSDDGRTLAFDFRVNLGAPVVLATFEKEDHRAYYRLHVAAEGGAAGSTKESTGGHSCPPPPPLPPFHHLPPPGPLQPEALFPFLPPPQPPSPAPLTSSSAPSPGASPLPVPAPPPPIPQPGKPDAPAHSPTEPGMAPPPAAAPDTSPTSPHQPPTPPPPARLSPEPGRMPDADMAQPAASQPQQGGFEAGRDEPMSSGMAAGRITVLSAAVSAAAALVAAVAFMVFHCTRRTRIGPTVAGKNAIKHDEHGWL